MQNKNSIVNAELWREAQTYGDIQLMPFVDYYDLITLKTIAICLMGVNIKFPVVKLQVLFEMCLSNLMLRFSWIFFFNQ